MNNAYGAYVSQHFIVKNYEICGHAPFLGLLFHRNIGVEKYCWKVMLNVNYIQNNMMSVNSVYFPVYLNRSFNSNFIRLSKS